MGATEVAKPQDDRVPFGLRSIPELDPAVGIAFAQEVERAAADCFDRPVVDKARTIVLKAELTPIVDQRGDCTGIALEVTVDGRRPVRRSMPFILGTNHRGQCWFDRKNPSDIRQPGIPFPAEESPAPAAP